MDTAREGRRSTCCRQLGKAKARENKTNKNTPDVENSVFFLQKTEGAAKKNEVVIYRETGR
jgi:hypothetical protein